MAMATRPNQLRGAAAAVILVVVVAMAATATGARRREDLWPGPLDIKVYCTEVHGVSAGETCASVARDARIELTSFMDLNRNITCGALFPGQWVCVRGVLVG